MKIVIYILLLGFASLVLPGNSVAQGQWVKLRKADRLYSYGKVNSSIFRYKSILEEDSTNIPANYELGKIYLLSKEDYPNSINHLTKAIDNFSRKKDSIYMAYYYLGEAQKLMGNYNEAVKSFEYFRKNGIESSQKSDIIRAEVTSKINECQLADSVFNGNSFNIVKVINLGSDVNSDLREYCSVYFPETNQLMYTARYQDNKRERKFLDMQYYESGYSINSQEKGQVPKLIEINPDKLDRVHFSVVGKTFSGDTVIFYKDNKLWLSLKIDGELSEPQVMPEQINRSYYQPHGVFSKDHKHFIFSSSEKKDFQLDLYITELQEDGTWSEAVLFSDKINTPYNEDSPFFSEDGNTLYFSSNKPGGFGKYDVYKSYLRDGEWGEPINMGMPINSSGEDIFFTYNNNEETGFISSNRGGGKGSMDIYMFTNTPYPSFDCDKFAEEFESEDNIPMIEILSDPYVNELMSFDASQSQFKDAEIKNVFWRVDGEVLKVDLSELKYAFPTLGEHEVTAQIYAYNSSNQEYIMQCATVNVDIVKHDQLFLQVISNRVVLENTDMELEADVMNMSKLDSVSYDWYVDSVLVLENDSLLNYAFKDTGVHLVTVKSEIIDENGQLTDEIEGFKEIYVYDISNKQAVEDDYLPGIVLNENKDPNSGKINALHAEVFNVPNDKIVFYNWYINNNYLKGKNSSLLAHDFQPLDVVKVVGNVMNEKDELEFSLEATKTIPEYDPVLADNTNNNLADNSNTNNTSDNNNTNSSNNDNNNTSNNNDNTNTGINNDNNNVTAMDNPNIALTNDVDPSTGDVTILHANLYNAPKGAKISYQWYVNGRLVDGKTAALLEYNFEPLDVVKVVGVVVDENGGEYTLESSFTVPDKAIAKGDGKLNPVYFEFDKYSLTQSAKSIIDNNITVLKADKSLKFKIEGNTDSFGASNYNIWLSRKRANMVYDYLKRNGVGDDQIVKVVANGESKPKAENRLSNGKDNPSGRQTNRRVDFVIVQ